MSQKTNIVYGRGRTIPTFAASSAVSSSLWCSVSPARFPCIAVVLCSSETQPTTPFKSEHLATLPIGTNVHAHQLYSPRQGHPSHIQPATKSWSPLATSSPSRRNFPPTAVT
ncbi:unnamed protein product [Chondrus crispus]|uniref:Uncharacterized protein n=1 Tax=Chondrus crispus TaxID=2769 RepID=R7Q6V2_CHOCR|nr:unnamed protein product [Chondrus crispus]CDF34267.1 unnamed protein product [Chondrus crispus]|eukprot:XP_005714086.1 unnamed protein product [Chondrus crispus]